MAAMGPASARDRRTYLVWCFEHYFQAEHAQAYRYLKNLADAFGFDFVCEKKSMGLLRWLESRAGTILLVAEWREAKPIMEELSTGSIACNVSMCVVTRSEKMFQRARSWVAQQGGEKEILVSEGFSPRKVEKIVTNHMERALVSADSTPPGLEIPTRLQPVRRFWL